MNIFRRLIISFICFYFITVCYSQTHLEGTANFNIKTGEISCDFTISNAPDLQDYLIFINEGMKVKKFRNKSGEKIRFSKKKKIAEAKTYKFSRVEKLPKTFSVSYSGTYPVYNNHYRNYDFKGLIAINDKTLRASEQTKWYPVIYDVKNDRLLDEYTYDIKINLVGGTSIFVNGNTPVKKKSARFISEKPYKPMVFLGNYDFIENKGNYIINAEVSQEKAIKIFENIDKIKKVLVNNLQQQFTDKIYLINHKALNKRKKGSSWGFNSYPTFAYTGLDFNKLVNERGALKTNNLRFFGHEFGHNYFGSNVMSGELYWFWSESFAEYLSYNVLEDFGKIDYLKNRLRNQASLVKDKSFIPLHEITRREQVNVNYRYNLGALILKCFEDTFGREKTNKTLQILLKKADIKTLILDDLKKSALESGISLEKYLLFESKYIKNKLFKENTIAHIVEKYKK